MSTSRWLPEWLSFEILTLQLFSLSESFAGVDLQKRILNVPIWAFAGALAFPCASRDPLLDKPCWGALASGSSGAERSTHQDHVRAGAPLAPCDKGTGQWCMFARAGTLLPSSSAAHPLAAQPVVSYRILKYRVNPSSGSYLSSPFPWKGACANLACPDRSAVTLWCCFSTFHWAVGKPQNVLRPSHQLRKLKFAPGAAETGIPGSLWYRATVVTCRQLVLKLIKWMSLWKSLGSFK